jgi:hypothetical protein
LNRSFTRGLSDSNETLELIETMLLIVFRIMGIALLLMTMQLSYISNSHSFIHKHPGVPDGADGSDEASYLPKEV